jgi:HlyD family secretion protein
MRKSILVVIILAAASAAGYGYYVYTKKDPAPTVAYAKVTRGDIAETVGATGTLQAVTTVQVGSQVSGIVSQLNADFNSLVHKGQVIARLDPSLFQTQIEQARANLIRAQADLDRLRVSSDDARTKLKRAEQLAAQNLIAQTDLEAAQVAVRSADAQFKSQEAAVTQAQASLQQNQVNLDHTIITAPIDGLVISRNVDVGQTVAASMSAPTLFVLAADLTKMQVVASLDESDVGRIRPKQVVRFRVDAYPTQEFLGSVTQVRLQPQTVQNVVTYSTVIDVPNPELKLKPGMTANVNIEIARRNNVLRISNAALRFRPTTEIFEALGQTPPAGGTGGGGGRGGRRGAGSGNAPSGTDSSLQPSQPASTMAANSSTPTSRQGGPDASTGTTATAPSRAASSGTSGAQATDAAPRRNRRNADQSASGATSTTGDGTSSGGRGGAGAGATAQGGGANGQGGFGGGRGGGRGNFQERMANMTPEERQQFMDRMRARGLDPEAIMAGRGGGGRQGGASGNAPANAQQRAGQAGGTGNKPQSKAPSQPSLASKEASATTIDALFGPLPPTETFGQAWLFQGGKLVRVPLRIGVTDGQQSELIQGNLKEGDDVVTSVVTAAQRAATNAGSTAFPGFQQNRGGGGFPGAGGPRGGGGGGGGRGGR